MIENYKMVALCYCICASFFIFLLVTTTAITVVNNKGKETDPWLVMKTYENVKEQYSDVMDLHGMPSKVILNEVTWFEEDLLKQTDDACKNIWHKIVIRGDTVETTAIVHCDNLKSIKNIKKLSDKITYEDNSYIKVTSSSYNSNVILTLLSLKLMNGESSLLNALDMVEQYEGISPSIIRDALASTMLSFRSTTDL